jgi:DNA-binding NarL/FixJ family response regulator
VSIGVLIADDQPLLRTGFRMILEAEPDIRVVGEAGDGRSAVAEARRMRPDIVLMDIRMPVMDGVEATRLLAGPGAPEPVIRVLVLTTFDLDEYIVEALRNGASGFLLKDAPAEQLVEAIRIVADGGALLAPSVTRRLLDAFAHRLPRADRGQPAVGDLTEREREVLRLLAAGKSNAEIADALVVSETTVKTHVSRVLMKLDLRDRVQAVVFAYETGLVRPGDVIPAQDA